MTDTAGRIDWTCRVLKARANAGLWNGRDPTPYFASCRMSCRLTPETYCTVLFTRDVGHHSSGWWKNPDYERCYHLSLSFVAASPLIGSVPTPLPRDAAVTREFVGRLFGPHRHLIWCEPPYSEAGKAADVWHYRLFCDPAWEPIHPRGEVYSKEFTEHGWLSYSDVQAGLAEEKAAAAAEAHR